MAKYPYVKQAVYDMLEELDRAMSGPKSSGDSVDYGPGFRSREVEELKMFRAEAKSLGVWTREAEELYQSMIS